jgi:hypothetical protein
MLKKRLLAGCFTALATLATSNAFADITMQQRIKVEAGGSLSFLSSGSTVTSSIANDKSWTESKTQSKSKLMGSFGGNNDSISIMRVDKDLVWQLSPEKKQYTEMTFEQMRAQIEEGMEQLRQLQQNGGESALPVKEEDCEWSNPILEKNDTGIKKRFANVKAEQHIITVRETCTVPESGQTCVLTWTTEHWMAKRMPGDDEAIAFNQAVAQKLGTEDMVFGAQAASKPLLAMFQAGWEEALDEMSELNGYPVKTVMQMEMGGESCTAMSGEQIAMDDVWDNAMDAGIDAAGRTAGQHAGQAVAKETADAMGDSVGGSIAGSAVGAASGEVISGFLKRFGKKNKKNKPEPVASAPAGTPTETETTAGSVVLFRITSELVEFSDDDVPADRFEVPAGWKKVSWN